MPKFQYCFYRATQFEAVSDENFHFFSFEKTTVFYVGRRTDYTYRMDERYVTVDLQFDSPSPQRKSVKTHAQNSFVQRQRHTYTYDVLDKYFKL